VRFTIGAGRVRGFSVTTRTACGVVGVPTYTQNTYNFPTTRIARRGIVDAQQRKALFTVSLRLRVAGGKVTSGSFAYSGPAGCSATESFTATRRGR